MPPKKSKKSKGAAKAEKVPGADGEEEKDVIYHALNWYRIGSTKEPPTIRMDQFESMIL